MICVFDNLSEEVKEQARAVQRQRTQEKIDWCNEKILHNLALLGVTEEELIAAGESGYSESEEARETFEMISIRTRETNFLTSIS